MLVVLPRTNNGFYYVTALEKPLNKMFSMPNAAIFIFREIDPAMLRRLEKRISVPLPDFKTRVELFEKFLNSKSIELVPKVDFKELAAKTEGYSGSDIKLVCKEALMCTVRKILPNMVGRSKFCSNRISVVFGSYKF